MFSSLRIKPGATFIGCPQSLACWCALDLLLRGSGCPGSCRSSEKRGAVCLETLGVIVGAGGTLGNEGGGRWLSVGTPSSPRQPRFHSGSPVALSLFSLALSLSLALALFCFENPFQGFLPFEGNSLRETWEGTSPSIRLNPVSLAQTALNTDS